MTHILDSFQANPKAFRPETISEYLALQLARKLFDADLVWRYRSLFDRHPLPLILQALSTVQSRRFAGRALIQAFEQELSALTNQDDDDAP